MNRTNFSALTAALAVSAMFVCNTLAAPAKPAPAMPSKFAVNVQCLNCAPPQSSRQSAAPDKNGNFNIDVPAHGQYKVSYADGPNKGKTITTITASSAGAVTVTIVGDSSSKPKGPVK